MIQATRVGELTFSDYVQRGLREAAMWALVCAAAYLVLSLASYSAQDPGWSHVGHREEILNAGGRFGAWFADLSLYLFGYFAYLIPIMVAWSAYLVFRRSDSAPEIRANLLALRWLGFFVTLGAGCAIVSVHLVELGEGLPNGTGGGIGQLIGGYLTAAFKPAGATLFLTAVFLAGFFFFSGISGLMILDAVGGFTLSLLRRGRGLLRALWDRHLPGRGKGGRHEPELIEGSVLVEPFEAEELDEPLRREAPDMSPKNRVDGMPPSSPAAAEPRWEDLEREAAPGGVETPEETDEGRVGELAEPRLELPEIIRGLLRRRREDGPGQPQDPPVPEVEPEPSPGPGDGRREDRGETASVDHGPILEIPPLALLDEARKSGKGYTKEMLDELSRQVEVKLADFGVSVEVVAVLPGPVVTLFELQLAPGIKVSKITGLAKDIARALSTVSVRVVEVIPGKPVIGLEIPNEQRETVFLSEVLSARVYQKARSPLTLALGTNISGQPVVADLSRMPHALIAGTTGSGKSVAINAMVLSLLYKAHPDDVRLIMVDPKMLELSVYEGIPHLLTPVVTDMKEAANALRWCVAEMERRYKLMSRLGVRNIAGYNEKVAAAAAAGEPIPDPLFVTPADPAEGMVPDAPPSLEHLPYIVVIIDELADMMMVVGKKVEELIARLAQKARASGIHLLLATQRPSVDVLTGLIKANIPTRMAFQVSSRIDSRTVLDQMGAEHLLGNGDMLYLPPGTSFPQRVHGAFVGDHEVHAVVDHLKQFGAPEYINTILQDATDAIPGIDPEPKAGNLEDQDPLFDEAVQIVTETRRASISGVQRRLKIGYNRAARMIEEMERIGLVGPAETNGNREVLAPPPPED